MNLFKLFLRGSLDLASVNEETRKYDAAETWFRKALRVDVGGEAKGRFAQFLMATQAADPIKLKLTVLTNTRQTQREEKRITAET